MIWPRKASWQNKANFLRVGEGPVDCSRQCRAARACQTKPVGGEWSRQTKPVGRRGAAGRNIPAFPLFQYSIIPAFQSDADRAKQTQFREVGRLDRAGCTNKANSRLASYRPRPSKDPRRERMRWGTRKRLAASLRARGRDRLSLAGRSGASTLWPAATCAVKE